MQSQEQSASTIRILGTNEARLRPSDELQNVFDEQGYCLNVRVRNEESPKPTDGCLTG